MRPVVFVPTRCSAAWVSFCVPVCLCALCASCVRPVRTWTCNVLFVLGCGGENVLCTQLCLPTRVIRLPCWWRHLMWPERRSCTPNPGLLLSTSSTAHARAMSSGSFTWRRCPSAPCAAACRLRCKENGQPHACAAGSAAEPAHPGLNPLLEPNGLKDWLQSLLAWFCTRNPCRTTHLAPSSQKV